jgi:hypothetical protein
MINAVRLDRGKSIKTIIVTCCAVRDVQRSVGVVKTVWIYDPVVDRGSSLIEMSMSIDV